MLTVSSLIFCLCRGRHVSRLSVSTVPARHQRPGTERVQALAGISRSALCYHSNQIRAPIVNPPNSWQLHGTCTVPLTYIRVRAVVWECSEGQTRRQTDTQTQTHSRPWQYTFRLGYASRKLSFEDRQTHTPRTDRTMRTTKLVGNRGFILHTPHAKCNEHSCDVRTFWTLLLAWTLWTLL